jgi:hypothetical protein
MISTGIDMSYLLALGLIWTMWGTASAQSVLWQRTYGGTSSDYGVAVVSTEDGGFLAVGVTYSYPTGGATSSCLLVRTVGDGDTLWQRSVSGFIDVHPRSLLPQDDGGFVILGSVTDQHHDAIERPWIAWIDSVGTLLREEVYGVVETGISAALGTPDGSFLLVSDGTNSSLDLLKIGHAGDSLWSRHFNGPMFQGIYGGLATLVTSDGGLAIAGVTNRSASVDAVDMLLLRLDANGDTLWTRSYGALDSNEAAYAMGATDDGGFLLAGISYPYETSGDFKEYPFFVRVDSAGNQLSSRLVDTVGNTQVTAMRRTADGNFVLTGLRSGQNTSSVILMGITQAGLPRSFTTLPFPGGPGRGDDLQLLEDGNVVITGEARDNLLLLRTGVKSSGVDAGPSRVYPSTMDLSNLDPTVPAPKRMPRRQGW